MKVILKWFLGLLPAVAVGLAGLLILARYSDGPLAIVAGGPFTSGEHYQGPELTPRS